MQKKSENHEICQDVMISYVEVVVNSWEVSAQFIIYDVYKPQHLQGSFRELRSIQLDLE
jgi:hypothetical protein